MEEGPNKPIQEETPEGRASTHRILDPGYGTLGGIQNQRLLNKDGSFNVRRTGTNWWALLHPYQFLILLPWWKFWIVVFISYLLINSGFAFLYMMAGIENLTGAPMGEDGAEVAFGTKFAYAFFFSVQTITTVGYGSISPTGMLVNVISAFEAMVGLLGFAFASGIMYGRFSRASAKISFSENLLLAPYHKTGGNALMFRIVNRRKNQMIELELGFVLLYYKMVDGKIRRQFFQLKLERDKVAVFPITWTIVHPIDEDSPLWKKDISFLMDSEAELLVNLKGYDDTFDKVVHIRYSYKYKDLVTGARFKPAYYHDEDGMIVLEIDKLGDYETVMLNPQDSLDSKDKGNQNGASKNKTTP
ncbi:MAG: ion channel [Bacteroidota bacterium]